MEIKRMKLVELNPAAYNPRIALKPGDPEFERLKNSIASFGNVEPIVWNKRTGNVVGGHQRLLVLKDMGEIETDVSVVDLTDEDEKLLNVALNKIKGDWDYDKLPELLSQFGPEDVKLSGFSPQEIAILCADVNAASEAVLSEFAERYDAEDEAEDDGSDDYGNDSYDGDEENYADDVPEAQPKGSVAAPAYDDGSSWVISMIFSKAAEAAAWLTEHGWGQQYKPGTHSTVVRVE